MVKSEVTESKFELSFLGAVAIVLFAEVIYSFLHYPFNMVLETTYVNSHKVLELVLNVLKELISKGLVIIFILKIIRGEFKPNFKIKYIEKFNFKLLLCTIFLILGFFMLYESSIGITVINKLSSKDLIEAFEEEARNTYQVIILQIIIAPIFEEIVMRGIILEGFLNKYKPITAVIVSSVIFGVWHGNIPQFINATILGIILGIIYYKTRSLVLCIVSHMLFNGLTGLYNYLNITTFIIGAVIFIISVVFFERYIRELKYDDINISSTDNSI